eukprot:gene9311-6550_t
MVQVDSVTLAPHVAASILEHAKRRVVASGLLLGQKTVDTILVNNFFPYVAEKVSHKEVSQRLETMRPFTSDSIIGWYSALTTRNPDGTENPDYVLWSKTPGSFLVGEKSDSNGRNAIHVHCEIPRVDGSSTTTDRPCISWEANFTLVRRAPVTDSSRDAPVEVMSLNKLKVSISANGHDATNVVLAHIRNQVLFKGEKPYPTPTLMNLDALAFQHTSKRQSAAESLLAAQKQLKELVDSHKNSSDARGKEIQSLVQEIRQLMDPDMAGSNANGIVGTGASAANKDDVVTHRLKDALMIKCLATLLKKSVTQIDVLSSQYPDAMNNNREGNNNNNTHGGGRGSGGAGRRPQNQQQDVPDDFRAGFGSRVGWTVPRSMRTSTSTYLTAIMILNEQDPIPKLLERVHVCEDLSVLRDSRRMEGVSHPETSGSLFACHHARVGENRNSSSPLGVVVVALLVFASVNQHANHTRWHDISFIREKEDQFVFCLIVCKEKNKRIEILSGIMSAHANAQQFIATPDPTLCHNSLQLEWAFGLHKDYRSIIHNLSTPATTNATTSPTGQQIVTNAPESRRVFYPVAHVGVIYDIVHNKQVHLRGHRYVISTSCCSHNRRFIVTIDEGNRAAWHLRKGGISHHHYDCANNNNSSPRGGGAGMAAAQGFPTQEEDYAAAAEEEARMIRDPRESRVEAEDDGSVMIVWDTHTAQPVKTIPIGMFGGAISCAMSLDGMYIATVNRRMPQEMMIWGWTAEDPKSDEDEEEEEDDPAAILLGVAQPKKPKKVKEEAPYNEGHNMVPEFVRRIPAQDEQTVVRFSSDDKTLLCTTGFRRVIFWSWKEGALKYYSPPILQKDLKVPVGNFTQSIYVPGTSLACSGTVEGDVVVWNLQPKDRIIKVQDKTLLKMVRVHSGGVTMLTCDQGFIITGGFDGHVKFLDTKLRVVAWYEELNGGPIISLSVDRPILPVEETIVDNETKAARNLLLASTAAASQFIATDFMISTANAMIVDVPFRSFHSASKELLRGKLVVQGQDHAIHSVCAHPFLPRVAIGGLSGSLHLWDFVERRVVMLSLFRNLLIQCMTFDKKGQFLVVGFTNGVLKVLDAETLEEKQSFKPKRQDSVLKLCFSDDSRMLATGTQMGYVGLYEYVHHNHDPSRPMEWEFVGHHKTHRAAICGLQFGHNTLGERIRLLSVGEDKRLIEYNLMESDVENGLQLRVAHKITQGPVPTGFLWTKKKLLDDESVPRELGADCMPLEEVEELDFLLLPTNEYKLGVYLSDQDRQCVKTVLAPTFGGPVNFMTVVDEKKGSDRNVLVYGTKEKVIGLVQLPLRGDPCSSMGLLAHPGTIHSVAISYDGQYIFTAGGEDQSMLQWKVDGTKIMPAEEMDETSSKDTCGKVPLDHLIAIIEGGPEGDLMKEVVDYFYYAQIRAQGEETTAKRELLGAIPFSQLPNLLRALGYYPSELELGHLTYEVANLYGPREVPLNEIDVDSIMLDFSKFMRLYVNYRPVFGITRQDIEAAFSAIGADAHTGQISRDAFFQMLSSKGEPLRPAEITAALTSLLGDGVRIDMLEEYISARAFAENLLGFEDYDGDSNDEVREEEEEASEYDEDIDLGAQCVRLEFFTQNHIVCMCVFEDFNTSTRAIEDTGQKKKATDYREGSTLAASPSLLRVNLVPCHMPQQKASIPRHTTLGNGAKNRETEGEKEKKESERAVVVGLWLPYQGTLAIPGGAAVVGLCLLKQKMTLAVRLERPLRARHSRCTNIATKESADGAEERGESLRLSPGRVVSCSSSQPSTASLSLHATPQRIPFPVRPGHGGVALTRHRRKAALYPPGGDGAQDGSPLSSSSSSSSCRSSGEEVEEVSRMDDACLHLHVLKHMSPSAGPTPPRRSTPVAQKRARTRGKQHHMEDEEEDSIGIGEETQCLSAPSLHERRAKREGYTTAGGGHGQQSLAAPPPFDPFMTSSRRLAAGGSTPQRRRAPASTPPSNKGQQCKRKNGETARNGKRERARSGSAKTLLPSPRRVRQQHRPPAPLVIEDDEDEDKDEGGDGAGAGAGAGSKGKRGAALHQQVFVGRAHHRSVRTRGLAASPSSPLRFVILPWWPTPAGDKKSGRGPRGIQGTTPAGAAQAEEEYQLLCDVVWQLGIPLCDWVEDPLTQRMQLLPHPQPVDQGLTRRHAAAPASSPAAVGMYPTHVLAHPSCTLTIPMLWACALGIPLLNTSFVYDILAARTGSGDGSAPSAFSVGGATAGSSCLIPIDPALHYHPILASVILPSCRRLLLDSHPSNPSTSPSAAPVRPADVSPGPGGAGVRLSAGLHARSPSSAPSLMSQLRRGFMEELLPAGQQSERPNFAPALLGITVGLVQPSSLAEVEEMAAASVGNGRASRGPENVEPDESAAELLTARRVKELVRLLGGAVVVCPVAAVRHAIQPPAGARTSPRGGVTCAAVVEGAHPEPPSSSATTAAGSEHKRSPASAFRLPRVDILLLLSPPTPQEVDHPGAGSDATVAAQWAAVKRSYQQQRAGAASTPPTPSGLEEELGVPLVSAAWIVAVLLHNACMKPAEEARGAAPPRPAQAQEKGGSEEEEGFQGPVKAVSVAEALLGTGSYVHFSTLIDPLQDALVSPFRIARCRRPESSGGPPSESTNSTSRTPSPAKPKPVEVLPLRATAEQPRPSSPPVHVVVEEEEEEEGIEEHRSSEPSATLDEDHLPPLSPAATSFDHSTIPAPSACAAAEGITSVRHSMVLGSLPPQRAAIVVLGDDAYSVAEDVQEGNRPAPLPCIPSSPSSSASISVGGTAPLPALRTASTMSSSQCPLRVASRPPMLSVTPNALMASDAALLATLRAMTDVRCKTAPTGGHTLSETTKGTATALALSETSLALWPLPSSPEPPSQTDSSSLSVALLGASGQQLGGKSAVGAPNSPVEEEKGITAADLAQGCGPSTNATGLHQQAERRCLRPPPPTVAAGAGAFLPSAAAAPPTPISPLLHAEVEVNANRATNGEEKAGRAEPQQDKKEERGTVIPRVIPPAAEALGSVPVYHEAEEDEEDMEILNKKDSVGLGDVSPLRNVFLFPCFNALHCPFIFSLALLFIVCCCFALVINKLNILFSYCFWWHYSHYLTTSSESDEGVKKKKKSSARRSINNNRWCRKLTSEAKRKEENRERDKRVPQNVAFLYHCLLFPFVCLLILFKGYCKRSIVCGINNYLICLILICIVLCECVGCCPDNCFIIIIHFFLFVCFSSLLLLEIVDHKEKKKKRKEAKNTRKRDTCLSSQSSQKVFRIPPRHTIFDSLVSNTPHTEEIIYIYIYRERERERDKNTPIARLSSSIFHIRKHEPSVCNGRYLLRRKIGNGSFGDIYMAYDTVTSSVVAVKLERKSIHYPQLEYEMSVYQILHPFDNKTTSRNPPPVDGSGAASPRRSMPAAATPRRNGGPKSMPNPLNPLSAPPLPIIPGIPRAHQFLKEGEYNIMVLDLCGPSLEDPFLDKKTHQHLPFSDKKPLTGTARYCACNAHRGYELSRRDDLESIGFLLVYFAKGSLPWQGIPGKDQRQKTHKIGETKLATSLESLCEGLPSAFLTYMNYCRNLEFPQEPDYEYLRELFRAVARENRYTLSPAIGGLAGPIPVDPHQFESSSFFNASVYSPMGRSVQMGNSVLNGDKHQSNNNPGSSDNESYETIHVLADDDPMNMLYSPRHSRVAPSTIASGHQSRAPSQAPLKPAPKCGRLYDWQFDWFRKRGQEVRNYKINRGKSKPLASNAASRSVIEPPGIGPGGMARRSPQKKSAAKNNGGAAGEVDGAGYIYLYMFACTCMGYEKISGEHELLRCIRTIPRITTIIIIILMRTSIANEDSGEDTLGDEQCFLLGLHPQRRHSDILVCFFGRSSCHRILEGSVVFFLLPSYAAPVNKCTCEVKRSDTQQTTDTRKKKIGYKIETRRQGGVKRKRKRRAHIRKENRKYFVVAKYELNYSKERLQKSTTFGVPFPSMSSSTAANAPINPSYNNFMAGLEPWCTPRLLHPLVVVEPSSDVDAIALKNGVDFVQLLRPFTRCQGAILSKTEERRRQVVTTHPFGVRLARSSCVRPVGRYFVPVTEEILRHLMLQQQHTELAAMAGEEDEQEAEAEAGDGETDATGGDRLFEPLGMAASDGTPVRAATAQQAGPGPAVKAHPPPPRRQDPGALLDAVLQQALLEAPPSAVVTWPTDGKAPVAAAGVGGVPPLQPYHFSSWPRPRRSALAGGRGSADGLPPGATAAPFARAPGGPRPRPQYVTAPSRRSHLGTAGSPTAASPATSFMMASPPPQPSPGNSIDGMGGGEPPLPTPADPLTELEVLAQSTIPPWYPPFLRSLHSLVRGTHVDTVDHPVGVIYAVSTREGMAEAAASGALCPASWRQIVLTAIRKELERQYAAVQQRVFKDAPMMSRNMHVYFLLVHDDDQFTANASTGRQGSGATPSTAAAGTSSSAGEAAPLYPLTASQIGELLKECQNMSSSLPMLRSAVSFNGVQQPAPHADCWTLLTLNSALNPVRQTPCGDGRSPSAFTLGAGGCLDPMRWVDANPLYLDIPSEDVLDAVAAASNGGSGGSPRVTGVVHATVKTPATNSSGAPAAAAMLLGKVTAQPSSTTVRRASASTTSSPLDADAAAAPARRIHSVPSTALNTTYYIPFGWKRRVVHAVCGTWILEEIPRQPQQQQHPPAARTTLHLPKYTGCYLSEGNITDLHSLLTSYMAHHLARFLERQVNLLAADIQQRRTTTFGKVAAWLKAETAKPQPEVVQLPSSSGVGAAATQIGAGSQFRFKWIAVEMQMRRCADLCMFLQDFDMAQTHYKLCRDELLESVTQFPALVQPLLGGVQEALSMVQLYLKATPHPLPAAPTPYASAGGTAHHGCSGSTGLPADSTTNPKCSGNACRLEVALADYLRAATPSYGGDESLQPYVFRAALFLFEMCRTHSAPRPALERGAAVLLNLLGTGLPQRCSHVWNAVVHQLLAGVYLCHNPPQPVMAVSGLHSAVTPMYANALAATPPNPLLQVCGATAVAASAASGVSEAPGGAASPPPACSGPTAVLSRSYPVQSFLRRYVYHLHQAGSHWFVECTQRPSSAQAALYCYRRLFVCCRELLRQEVDPVAAHRSGWRAMLDDIVGKLVFLLLPYQQRSQRERQHITLLASPNTPAGHQGSGAVVGTNGSAAQREERRRRRQQQRQEAEALALLTFAVAHNIRCHLDQGGPDTVFKDVRLLLELQQRCHLTPPYAAVTPYAPFVSGYMMLPLVDPDSLVIHLNYYSEDSASRRAARQAKESVGNRLDKEWRLAEELLRKHYQQQPQAPLPGSPDAAAAVVSKTGSPGGSLGGGSVEWAQPPLLPPFFFPPFVGDASSLRVGFPEARQHMVQLMKQNNSNCSAAGQRSFSAGMAGDGSLAYYPYPGSPMVGMSGLRTFGSVMRSPLGGGGYHSRVASASMASWNAAAGGSCTSMVGVQCVAPPPIPQPPLLFTVAQEQCIWLTLDMLNPLEVPLVLSGLSLVYVVEEEEEGWVSAAAEAASPYREGAPSGGQPGPFDSAGTAEDGSAALSGASGTQTCVYEGASLRQRHDTHHHHLQPPPGHLHVVDPPSGPDTSTSRLSSPLTPSPSMPLDATYQKTREGSSDAAGPERSQSTPRVQGGSSSPMAAAAAAAAAGLRVERKTQPARNPKAVTSPTDTDAERRRKQHVFEIAPFETTTLRIPFHTARLPCAPVQVIGLAWTLHLPKPGGAAAARGGAGDRGPTGASAIPLESTTAHEGRYYFATAMTGGGPPPPPTHGTSTADVPASHRHTTAGPPSTTTGQTNASVNGIPQRLPLCIPSSHGAVAQPPLPQPLPLPLPSFLTARSSGKAGKCGYQLHAMWRCPTLIGAPENTRFGITPARAAVTAAFDPPLPARLFDGEVVATTLVLHNRADPATAHAHARPCTCCTACLDSSMGNLSSASKDEDGGSTAAGKDPRRRRRRHCAHCPLAHLSTYDTILGGYARHVTLQLSPHNACLLYIEGLSEPAETTTAASNSVSPRRPPISAKIPYAVSPPPGSPAVGDSTASAAFHGPASATYTTFVVADCIAPGECLRLPVRVRGRYHSVALSGAAGSAAAHCANDVMFIVGYIPSAFPTGATAPREDSLLEDDEDTYGYGGSGPHSPSSVELGGGRHQRVHSTGMLSAAAPQAVRGGKRAGHALLKASKIFPLPLHSVALHRFHRRLQVDPILSIYATVLPPWGRLDTGATLGTVDDPAAGKQQPQQPYAAVHADPVGVGLRSQPPAGHRTAVAGLSPAVALTVKNLMPTPAPSPQRPLRSSLALGSGGALYITAITATHGPQWEVRGLPNATQRLPAAVPPGGSQSIPLLMQRKPFNFYPYRSYAATTPASGKPAGDAPGWGGGDGNDATPSLRSTPPPPMPSSLSGSPRLLRVASAHDLALGDRIPLTEVSCYGDAQQQEAPAAESVSEKDFDPLKESLASRRFLLRTSVVDVGKMGGEAPHPGTFTLYKDGAEKKPTAEASEGRQPYHLHHHGGKAKAATEEERRRDAMWSERMTYGRCLESYPPIALTVHWAVVDDADAGPAVAPELVEEMEDEGDPGTAPGEESRGLKRPTAADLWRYLKEADDAEAVGVQKGSEGSGAAEPLGAPASTGCLPSRAVIRRGRLYHWVDPLGFLAGLPRPCTAPPPPVAQCATATTTTSTAAVDGESWQVLAARRAQQRSMCDVMLHRTSYDVLYQQPYHSTHWYRGALSYRLSALWGQSAAEGSVVRLQWRQDGPPLGPGGGTGTSGSQAEEDDEVAAVSARREGLTLVAAGSVQVAVALRSYAPLPLLVSLHRRPSPANTKRRAHLDVDPATVVRGVSAQRQYLYALDAPPTAAAPPPHPSAPPHSVPLASVVLLPGDLITVPVALRLRLYQRMEPREDDDDEAGVRPIDVVGPAPSSILLRLPVDLHVVEVRMRTLLFFPPSAGVYSGMPLAALVKVLWAMAREADTLAATPKTPTLTSDTDKGSPMPREGLAASQPQPPVPDSPMLFQTAPAALAPVQGEEEEQEEDDDDAQEGAGLKRAGRFHRYRPPPLAQSGSPRSLSHSTLVDYSGAGSPYHVLGTALSSSHSSSFFAGTAGAAALVSMLAGNPQNTQSTSASPMQWQQKEEEALVLAEASSPVCTTGGAAGAALPQPHASVPVAEPRRSPPPAAPTSGGPPLSQLLQTAALLHRVTPQAFPATQIALLGPEESALATLRLQLLQPRAPVSPPTSTQVGEEGRGESLLVWRAVAHRLAGRCGVRFDTLRRQQLVGEAPCPPGLSYSGSGTPAAGGLSAVPGPASSSLGGGSPGVCRYSPGDEVVGRSHPFAVLHTLADCLAAAESSTPLKGGELQCIQKNNNNNNRWRAVELRCIRLSTWMSLRQQRDMNSNMPSSRALLAQCRTKFIRPGDIANFIAEGADVSYRGTGSSPLHLLVARRDVGLFLEALRTPRPVNFNVQNTYGETPLHLITNAPKAVASALLRAVVDRLRSHSEDTGKNFLTWAVLLSKLPALWSIMMSIDYFRNPSLPVTVKVPSNVWMSLPATISQALVPIYGVKPSPEHTGKLVGLLEEWYLNAGSTTLDPDVVEQHVRSNADLLADVPRSSQTVLHLLAANAPVRCVAACLQPSFPLRSASEIKGLCLRERDDECIDMIQMLLGRLCCRHVPPEEWNALLAAAARVGRLSKVWPVLKGRVSLRQRKINLPCTWGFDMDALSTEDKEQYFNVDDTDTLEEGESTAILVRATERCRWDAELINSCLRDGADLCFIIPYADECPLHRLLVDAPPAVVEAVLQTPPVLNFNVKDRVNRSALHAVLARGKRGDALAVLKLVVERLDTHMRDEADVVEKCGVEQLDFISRAAAKGMLSEVWPLVLHLPEYGDNVKGINISNTTVRRSDWDALGHEQERFKKPLLTENDRWSEFREEQYDKKAAFDDDVYDVYDMDRFYDSDDDRFGYNSVYGGGQYDDDVYDMFRSYDFDEDWYD